MNKINELIDDMKLGKMVILVDDEDRENEGDLILAADHVSAEHINFMAKEARGLICLTLTSDKCNQLGLPLMVSEQSNLSPNCTAFTVSIEASSGISTGISAADRAHTIKVAAKGSALPSDIIMPGHVFPIRAQNGGVLKRAGHTEASVDLARLAGLTPAAVICEIMNDDGSMARVPELREFSKKHNIKIGTIAELIEYRIHNESFVDVISNENFDSKYCDDLQLYTFINKLNGLTHHAFVKGDPKFSELTTVRVQKQNILKDVFSGDSTENTNVELAFKSLAKAEAGVFVYISGDSNVTSNLKLDMEKRDYGVGAQILRALGVKKIRLITNHPESKLVGLNGFGLSIIETMTLGEDAKIQKINMDKLEVARSIH